MSVELRSKLLVVSIFLQPSISIPEGRDPPLVCRAVFLMTSASMHSYFILCMDCVITFISITVYQSHFHMGVFALKG